MQPTITVSELRVVRGTTEALRGVSLDVVSGRVTGLLGPSGSGKTTLMRSVVGVQLVASGRVEVLGSPAGSPELRRRVA
ncbi:MAG: ATP-binding cassette domain-containing protein, partial [Thermoleophilia bacterium]|nr:ATP-binding cassette domain-containing protein [Thermoleophilia bacterium]